MTASHDHVERVSEIIREVSAEVIEPRFGALGAEDAHVKSPGEIVTVADAEAERLLARRLGDLIAGAAVVGEEAAAANPAVLDGLTAPATWVIDPLDGTANFADGAPDWAVMVALLDHGTTVVSWIWQPLRRRMYIAEQGGGATCNGVTVRRAPGPANPGSLTGSVLRRFLDTPMAANVVANEGRVGWLGSGRGCAGMEYPALVDGEQDFVVFWRTLPWDHAPGALLAEESGAVVARPDGSPYRPAHRSSGLIAAADSATWNIARSLLDPR